MHQTFLIEDYRECDWVAFRDYAGRIEQLDSNAFDIHLARQSRLILDSLVHISASPIQFLRLRHLSVVVSRCDHALLFEALAASSPLEYLSITIHLANVPQHMQKYFTTILEGAFTQLSKSKSAKLRTFDIRGHAYSPPIGPILQLTRACELRRFEWYMAGKLFGGVSLPPERLLDALSGAGLTSLRCGAAILTRRTFPSLGKSFGNNSGFEGLQQLAIPHVLAYRCITSSNSATLTSIRLSFVTRPDSADEDITRLLEHIGSHCHQLTAIELILGPYPYRYDIMDVISVPLHHLYPLRRITDLSIHDVSNMFRPPTNSIIEGVARAWPQIRNLQWHYDSDKPKGSGELIFATSSSLHALSTCPKLELALIPLDPCSLQSSSLPPDTNRFPQCSAVALDLINVDSASDPSSFAQRLASVRPLNRHLRQWLNLDGFRGLASRGRTEIFWERVIAEIEHQHTA